METRRRILVKIALLVAAGVAPAHHSQSMFVETPVWVTGTVTRYRAVDPHVMIELEQSPAGGDGARWIVEGPRMGRLERILQDRGGIRPDQILKVGDRISVCGFPLKKDFDSERMYADWPVEHERFVHGQVVVMPDGQMQSWGPYGAIDNCVRAGDTAQTWISFLNRDPLARGQWCTATSLSGLTHPAPRSFIDQVNHGLRVPCV
jgi:hypothetical protein